MRAAINYSPYYSCITFISVSLTSWEKPDKTFYIEQTHLDKNLHKFPRFNNITFRLAERPLLLEDASSEKIELCSPENDDVDGMRHIKHCGDGFCECTHVISVPQGKVSSFIIKVVT